MAGFRCYDRFRSTTSMRTRNWSRILASSVRHRRRALYIAVLGCVLGFTTGRFQQLSASPPEPQAGESTASEGTHRASTAGPRERRPVDIRVDKTLVLIHVTVTDPLNRFVTGLEKEHFRLYEEKVEQDITQFSSEDAPISIGLVFDTSGSMGA